MLSTIGSDAGYYLVGLQLYPQIQVQAIAQSKIRPKEYPREIAEFISGLTMVRPDRWKGDDSVNPAPYEECNRLIGAIPGEQFDDGKSRLFLRHFTFGHRTFTTQICDGLNQQQLNFYEAFTPNVFTLKSGRITVDKEYAGVEKDGYFQYPCGLKKLIQSRTKLHENSTVEHSQNSDVLSFLEERSLITPEERGFNRHEEERWEFNTLRNLIEGRALYNK
ncbi:hypothetical protein ACVIST_000983 [Bradyrhizobium elkanii]